MSSPRVALLTQDLMFSSRLAAEARRSGIDLVVLPGQSSLLPLPAETGVAGLLIDLETPGLDVAELMDAVRRGGVSRVAAYGPHVHAGRLAAATAAGCDEVLSRGQLDKSSAAVLRRLAGIP
jgi:hypothetical protein